MSETAESRLAELGITLPTPRVPAFSYVPYVESDMLLFVSGQIPMGPEGPECRGKLGAGYSIEQGQEAAKLCAIQVLAVAKMALGDLERVRRCVKLTGFINSAPDFGDQPKVMNGASDLIVAALGEKGQHARSAVGVAGLPFGVAVEVEAIFEVE